jgi:hypothetical protein
MKGSGQGASSSGEYARGGIIGAKSCNVNNHGNNQGGTTRSIGFQQPRQWQQGSNNLDSGIYSGGKGSNNLKDSSSGSNNLDSGSRVPTTSTMSETGSKQFQQPHQWQQQGSKRVPTTLMSSSIGSNNLKSGSKRVQTTSTVAATGLKQPRQWQQKGDSSSGSIRSY